MVSITPAYNLKVVLKETGLPADTLRAWERRYGLPAPQRTAGGHRLYSERDIHTIKWLMARQAEGFSISRAVDLWNEQLASSKDPLAGQAPSALTSPQTALANYAPAETTLNAMRAQWINACINFNETGAEQTLNQAFSMFPVEAVCVEVLQKGMSEIGNMWYENRTSVQQEHFASGLAIRRLDALLIASPAPSRGQTILVGCPAGEWHTFVPLMLSLFLRRRGLNVIYLGANVPIERFEETVHAVRANLVILAGQTLASAATLQQTAFALTSKHHPVAYGGRIFNVHADLIKHISGHHLGNDVSASIEEVEHILSGKRKSMQTQSASQENVAAHQFFTSKRVDIEMTLRSLINPLAVSSESFQTGIQFLGDNIAAALQLGDMGHVSDEMEWVKYLLHAYQRPAEELIVFMDAYAQAVNQHINGSGKPIYEWLAAEAEKLKAK
ncbi:MAG: MerR family transcriptional regulator [Chloroflexi bacterium]|nr:MerR family transcriptional regulator [Chloroflexota bacterium]